MAGRYRIPDPKPDTMIVCWGREDSHAAPSIVYVYPDRDGKSDAILLCGAFEEKRCTPDSDNFGKLKLIPSLVKELESRGYDIKTLKFSIKRKKKDVNDG